MPAISTPSKIDGTKSYGAKVIFSGSTSQEREAVVATVMAETGAILVPPYDHPDTILGQGTVGIELEEQAAELVKANPALSVHGGSKASGTLDAVVVPTGGGGLTSGVATFFANKPTSVFGSEPSFQGGDDCRRGLASGERIESVKTLTIADGLRTPVGKIPWTVLSDPKKLRGVYSVTEEQIKAAMKLVIERMKVVIEPSSAVPLAVCLYNEEFRRLVEREAGEEGWDIGVVFTGGNTTVEAIAKLFGGSQVS
jgi:threonine dehydratase